MKRTDGDAQKHWDDVYLTNLPENVSWFQRESSLSLELITKLAPKPTSAILDVGAGASTLVDGLLNKGYSEISILDLSGTALKTSQERLGARSRLARWIEADALTADLQFESFDVWHDRALFHFLTEEDDRRRYVDRVRSLVKQGGHVIIATFAENGPTSCSGLKVERYSIADLHRAFGEDFQLIEGGRELHRTPSGGEQPFTYCVLRLQPIRQ